jgi:hypothetical protein
MALWTGCIAGSLLDSDYRNKLDATGFVDIEIVPTLVHDRAAVERLTTSITLPEGYDRERALVGCDGAVANASIRARRPH